MNPIVGLVKTAIGTTAARGATASLESLHVQAMAMPPRKLPVAELVFWSFVCAAFFALPGYLALGSQILIAGLFALSLDIVLGQAGILSLGHAAFFGVGAYTAAILAAHGHGEPLSGLVLAALASALVGWLTSFIVLRGGNLARLMITLGIAALLRELANQSAWLTGGVDGVQGMEMKPLLGIFAFDIDGRTAFLYSVAVLVAVFVPVRLALKAPMGLSLTALRENEVRMSAIGVPVKRRLRLYFVIGAALAGIAGALLAQTTQYVALDVLGVQRSADVLIMVAIGGVGRFYGGLIGALAFMVVHHVLSNINPVYWQFYMGLLLILLVLVGKGGLLGLADRIVAWGHRVLGGGRR